AREGSGWSAQWAREDRRLWEGGVEAGCVGSEAARSAGGRGDQGGRQGGDGVAVPRRDRRGPAGAVQAQRLDHAGSVKRFFVELPPYGGNQQDLGRGRGWASGAQTSARTISWMALRASWTAALVAPPTAHTVSRSGRKYFRAVRRTI